MTEQGSCRCVIWQNFTLHLILSNDFHTELGDGTLQTLSPLSATSLPVLSATLLNSTYFDSIIILNNLYV